jgi:hypothetical protein
MLAIALLDQKPEPTPTVAQPAAQATLNSSAAVDSLRIMVRHLGVETTVTSHSCHVRPRFRRKADTLRL